MLGATAATAAGVAGIAGIQNRLDYTLQNLGNEIIQTTTVESDASYGGRIVVESDLVDALRSQRIAGAGLDVFETEPLPVSSPLRLLPNVVLSPHAAGITREATEAGLSMAIGNVLAFRAGSPSHVVT